MLSFDDNRLASLVFGQYDQDLAHLERRLGVVVSPNGNHVTVKGARETAEQAGRVLKTLYARAKAGAPVTLGEGRWRDRGEQRAALALLSRRPMPARPPSTRS